MKKCLLILFSRSHHHTVCGCLGLIKLTCVIVSGRKGENKQLVKRSMLLFSVQDHFSPRASWITTFPHIKLYIAESCLKMAIASLLPLN